MGKKLVDALWMLSMLIAIVLMFAFGIWGIAILFLQGVVWFKSGNWTPIPARAAFYYTPGDYPALIERALPSSIGGSEFSRWLQSPQFALGPHQLITYFLKSTSMWFFFLLTALAVILVWAIVHAEFAKWSSLLENKSLS